MNFVDRPEELHLTVLSFLDTSGLRAAACTCKRFAQLTIESPIWQQRAELEFGKLVAEGAKSADKSWKQTYEALEASRKLRADNIGKVTQSQVFKSSTDKTARVAASLFGFANPNAHYYPTGQIGYLGNRKITVFKTL